MIKVDNGQIHIMGSKQEIGTEYMHLTEVLLKKEIFDSRNELLACVQFASAGEEEQRDIVMQILDGMINYYEGMKGD